MSSHSVTLDSESAYAKHRQIALALINQLRAIGAQADLDLPRIAVIGNQSAGKSSLVEAISGINVPRDAGTCTRCPIECRLAYSSDSWRCKVSVRWEFDANGIRNDEIAEVQFGPELTDPKAVEFALRRAQAAVLNPKIRTEIYEKMSAKELEQTKSTNELKFSRNSICVDLSGPQLTDLAFVDLPGIVQNADDEVVKLVEDLVLFHIKGNCLILVALPMSDDMENQKAMRLAREVDPYGLRTIGVLTKPDLVTTAQQKSRWLDVIEGRAYLLKHGYYCTRQPDEDERGHGITPAEARVEEADFFMKTLPWATSAHQSRLGTQNLVTNLSRLLSKVIDERLPTLSNETTRQLTDCESRLAALPAPITSEPSAFVLGLVTSFCNDVRSYIQGQTLATDLVQDTRRTYRTFRSDIRSTAPHFLPLEDMSARTLELKSDIQDLLKLDDEGEDGGAQPTVCIYLKDVRERIAKAVTRELPNNVPYPAKVSFIKDFQKQWESHVHKCATAVHRTLEDRMTQLVKSTFGPYVHLEPRISHIVNQLVQSAYKEANAQLARILKYETSPFTQNEHYLSASKEAFLTKYKAMRMRSTKKAAPWSQSFQDVRSSTSRGNASKPVSSKPTISRSVSPWGNPWKPFDQSSGYRSDCPGSGVYFPCRPLENHAEVVFQSITASLPYSRWSFEELRVADYSGLRKSAPEASTEPPTANGPFGQSVAQKSAAPTGGLFGQSAAQTSAAPTATAFLGQPVAQTSAAPTATSPFAQPDTQKSPAPMTFGGTFGRSAAPESPAPTGTGLFGQADTQRFPAPTTVASTASAPGLGFPATGYKSIFGSNGQAYNHKQDEADILSGLARLGITGLSMEDILGKLNPVDQYEEEIEVMAEVRAYFKVSYKRIIDYVPLAIDHDFLFVFTDALQDCMFEKLGLGTKDAADKCAAYLAEDLHVVAAREELLSRRKRLEKVQQELLNFGL